MKFKTFQEYIDQNGNVQTKAKVAKVADYEGNRVTKPGKAEMPKDAGGKGTVGEPAPYVGGDNAKDPNKEDESGLVYKGDKNLRYEPNVDADPEEKKSWPKTTVEEWVKQTKKLSLAEFTKNMIKNESSECQSFALEATRNMIEACKCSEKSITNFVRDVKRNKMLEAFLVEMLNHNESFTVLAKLIESDESYARKIDKALNEMVASPIGMDSDEESEKYGDEEDEEGSEGCSASNDEDMGDEDYSDEDEDDMGDEDMGDEEPSEDDMGDEDMGDEEEDMGDEDYSDEDMGGENRMPRNPFMPKY